MALSPYVGQPRWGLRARMMAAFFAVAAVTVGIGAFGVFQQTHLRDRVTVMLGRDVIPMADLQATAAAHYQAVILGAVMENVRAPEARAVLQQNLDANLARADESLGRLGSSVPSELRPAVERLVADRSAFMTAHHNRMAATKAGDRVAEARYDKQAQAGLATVTQDFAALTRSLTDDASRQRQTVISETSRSSWLTVVLLLAGASLALFLGWVLVRGIMRSVRELRGCVERLAAGDLTEQATTGGSHDELGRIAPALGQAVSAIRGIVAGVSESAGGLDGAAQRLAVINSELAASARSTSQRAAEVSSAAAHVSDSVAAAAAGVDEMGASIQEIACNSADAAAVGTEASNAAATTKTIVDKLGTSSAEIDQVLQTITAIAEQTNLLALNATIESARAGEAGKGFSVVATEVKDLAQETARATEDIGRRIAAIQVDTRAAVDAIGEIAEITSRVTGFQTAIAAAIEEQSATSREVGRGVSDAAAGTTTIAVTITEVAAAAGQTSNGVSGAESAAEELSQLSAQLQAMITRFTY